jgi:hypothetical protein
VELNELASCSAVLWTPSAAGPTYHEHAGAVTKDGTRCETAHKYQRTAVPGDWDWLLDATLVAVLVPDATKCPCTSSPATTTILIESARHKNAGMDLPCC